MAAVLVSGMSGPAMALAQAPDQEPDPAKAGEETKEKEPEPAPPAANDPGESVNAAVTPNAVNDSGSEPVENVIIQGQNKYKGDAALDELRKSLPELGDGEPPKKTLMDKLRDLYDKRKDPNKLPVSEQQEIQDLTGDNADQRNP